MYRTQNVVLERSELVDLSRNFPSLAQNFVSMGKCMESDSGRHSRYPPISTSDGDASDNTHLSNRHCFILLHLVDTVHGVVVCNICGITQALKEEQAFLVATLKDDDRRQE